MNKLKFGSVESIDDIFKILEVDDSLWTIVGEVMIRNEERNLIDSFKVKLVFDPKVKKGFPKISELGNSIPWNPDRHVNGDGTLCLTVIQREIILCSQGIDFTQFIKSVLYPYLVNQSLINNGDADSFVMGEYDHQQAGILEFYREQFPGMSLYQIGNIIGFVKRNKISRRLTKKCPCGSNRSATYCHYNKMIELQSLGNVRLDEDLQIIDKIVNPVA